MNIAAFYIIAIKFLLCKVGRLIVLHKYCCIAITHPIRRPRNQYTSIEVIMIFHEVINIFIINLEGQALQVQRYQVRLLNYTNTKN